jgi:hypothetical protein
MDVQPVRPAAAIAVARAALLKNVISYPKTRLLNGIPQTQLPLLNLTIVAIQGRETVRIRLTRSRRSFTPARWSGGTALLFVLASVNQLLFPCNIGQTLGRNIRGDIQQESR